MRKHHVFSFFSGSGLLDLGFDDAGYDVVFVNEYFSPFLAAYKYSREKLGKKAPRFGYSDDSVEGFLAGADKNNLTNYMKVSRSLSASVGFIGGPPCPDFSVGGKNKGSKGQNGRLSRIYVDLIVKQKPDWFVFENVKGLFRTAKHKAFFDVLMSDLEGAGYVVSYDLLNSIEFGVPQDRDRIIVFGVHKNILAGQKKKSESNKKYKHYSDLPELNLRELAQYPERTAFDFNWPETSAFNASRCVAPKNIPVELTIDYWFKKNDTDNHPNTSDCFTPRAGLAKFETVLEGDVSKKSYKRLHRWRYSPTAAYGNNEVHLHPYKPRRLTVAEALAIQSLPKDFVLPPDMTLSNKFKTIGNGVPYLMALKIAKTLKKYIEATTESYDKICDKAASNS